MKHLVGRINDRNRPATQSGDDVYEHLLKAITDQRLLPGTKLTEFSLVETFGLGRRAVAAALSRLTLEKLVTVLPNRGAFVAAPDSDEARDIFLARTAIEAGTIEAIARRPDPQAIAAMEANIAEEAACRAAGKTREAIRLSGGFHLVIARHSGSPILAEQVRILVARTSLVIGLFENETGLSCWHDHHRELVEHCRHGRVEEAIAEMKAHIRELAASIALDRRRPTSFDLSDVFIDAR